MTHCKETSICHRYRWYTTTFSQHWRWFKLYKIYVTSMWLNTKLLFATNSDDQ